MCVTAYIVIQIVVQYALLLVIAHNLCSPILTSISIARLFESVSEYFMLEDGQSIGSRMYLVTGRPSGL